jgi:hypothetical protein
MLSMEHVTICGQIPTVVIRTATGRPGRACCLSSRGKRRFTITTSLDVDGRPE